MLEYIGYYDLDGTPCEVRTLEEDAMSVGAYGYFQGKGFQPVDLAEVLFHAERITLKEFKLQVTALARNKAAL